MRPVDYLLIAGILLLIGGIVFFVVHSKRKGKKCIGCPHSGSCSGSCGQ